MTVRAVVVDGVIVEFEKLAFSPEIGVAFDGHFQWLSSRYPDRLASQCPDDGSSPECSKLLVDTVEEWVATR